MASSSANEGSDIAVQAMDESTKAVGRCMANLECYDRGSNKRR